LNKTIAYLATAILLSVPPFQSNASSIGLPYCNGVTSVTEEPEYISPRKLALNGDHLRLWVERSVPLNTKETETMVHFDVNWGVGYQLDGSTITGITPIAARDQTVLISFSHLRKGPHRLRVGLMSPEGELVDDNALCFSTPGRFTATDR
jgi:hypothetical protein